MTTKILALGDKCCGCSACHSICPKKCIEMRSDGKGFLYPSVDESVCVSCGACERVCPALSDAAERKPLAVYASKNRDESIRQKSSSGGVFSALAEKVIKEGGVVFGARFDSDWSVVHDSADTIADLNAFRGSKYLQSVMGDCFSRAEKELKAGRQVLFSGTPCQSLGLRKFLRKDYDNLLVVDFVCHGVPSPKVWHSYLDSVCPDTSCISNISFRNKDGGWKKYRLRIDGSAGDESASRLVCEPFYENTFMRAFLWDLCLRPSCSHCPAKAGSSCSDITIGDYWGIENVMPELDDDRGVSLVMSYTEKGRQAFASVGVQNKESDYQKALAGNPSIERRVAKKPLGAMFWRLYGSCGLKIAVGGIAIVKAVSDFCYKCVRKLRRIMGWHQS